MTLSELVVGKALVSMFVGRYEAARWDDLDIRPMIIRVLNQVLGETGSRAVIYSINEKSLEDPKQFADGVQKVFGTGGLVILEKLLGEYESFASTIRCSDDST